MFLSSESTHSTLSNVELSQRPRMRKNHTLCTSWASSRVSGVEHIKLEKLPASFKREKEWRRKNSFHTSTHGSISVPFIDSYPLSLHRRWQRATGVMTLMEICRTIIHGLSQLTAGVSSARCGELLNECIRLHGKKAASSDGAASYFSMTLTYGESGSWIPWMNKKMLNWNIRLGASKVQERRDMTEF